MDAEEPSGTAAPGYRVLVVDDDLDSTTSLRLLLELTGYEVRTADGGQEGLRVAASFLPRVALVDLGMPGIDGYELARSIREQPWGKGMFLIAVSGWGLDEVGERSRAAGFDLHLTKPVDFDRMRRLLAAVPDLDRP